MDVHNRNVGFNSVPEKAGQNDDGVNFFKKEQVSFFSDDYAEVDDVPQEDGAISAGISEAPDIAKQTKKDLSKYDIGSALSGSLSADDNFGGDDLSLSTKIRDGAGHFKDGGINEQNLDRMSGKELKIELDSANKQLTDKQELLNSVQDDSAPAIKGMKNAVEDSFKVYKEHLEQVDVTLAKQVDEMKKSIENKQLDIKQKDKEISDKKTDISNRESDYQNITESIEMLEDGIAKIESDPKLKGQLNSAKRQLEIAQRALKIAKLALEHNKHELTKLEQDKSDLEEELKALNAKDRELNMIVETKSNEVQKLLHNYNEMKNNYEKEKQNAIDTVNNDIEQAQNYIKEIEEEIQETEGQEIKSDFGNIILPKEISEQLGSKIGSGFNNEIELLCKQLNCKPDELLKYLDGNIDIDSMDTMF